MAIPLATTTITVIGVRPQSALDPDGEGYGDTTSTPSVLVTGLRACISRPAFRRQVGETDQEDVKALRCDPFEITRFDAIVDETTGEEYEVVSAGPSEPVQWGLQHTVAFIKISRGMVGKVSYNVGRPG